MTNHNLIKSLQLAPGRVFGCAWGQRRSSLRLLTRLLTGLLVTFSSTATAQDSAPVVVMQSADANTLDPTMNRETSTFNILLNIYDGLLFKEADGSFSPGLAESWQRIDDLTWEFTLREGVTFHNGEALTAEAVAFTINRILDPETESPIARGFAFIESIDVTGELNFTITTSSPQPLAESYFAELLTIPPGYFEEVGAEAFAESPIGTGPFVVDSWQRDVAVQMTANPDYWRGLAGIDSLEFRPVPEALTRFSSLAAGEADLIVNVPASLVPSIESNDALKLDTIAGARVIFIGMNTLADSPVQDPLVRQALNYAVDVEAIIAGVLGGLATPTTTLLTDIDLGYNAALDPYPYDPERARELLAEAGYGDGLSLRLETPNGRYVSDVQVAQAIAAQLEAVGVTVDFEVREYGAYVGDLFAGNAPDLFLLGWGNAVFDADFILYPLTRTEGLLSFYSNPDLDTFLDEGSTSVDADVRRQAYEGATVLLQEEAPFIYLYKQQDAYGISERLDWTPRADEFLWLYSASVTE
ncbi:MAG: ABC transporter substrate-binding protein [Deinococcota bacterium]